MSAPEPQSAAALPAAARVRLRVFDVRGRMIRTLVDGLRPAGTNQATWDGRDNTGRRVASGTYYARLIADGQVSVRTLVLVK